MPNRMMPKLLLILILIMGISLLQYCEEEGEEDGEPTQAQLSSSCAECHTDSDALEVLAVEESDGGEESGEG